MSMHPRRALRALLVACSLTLAPATAAAQWSTTYEQFYLQAPHNWEFRNKYAHADRLFNAFDYGHAILYEKLWTKPGAPASLLEEKEYDFLTKRVLVDPPRVPLEEGAIEIRYAQLAPEAKVMFEWAHILHRQIYDVLGDESLSQARKDAEVARLVAYYKSRPGVAFSSLPKSMKLMQEQPYSLAFRQKYPKFNGLIWGYHWLQVGLYEPLVVGRDADERQAGVRATVARFWQMLSDPPRTLPYQMPMTAAIAPRFAERYTEAAIIFDNLHSMHDVISDILANPSVPRDRKRAEILRAATLFRDDTSYIMTVEGWRTMARHMGIENMGGLAVGFLDTLPKPTVTYGAVMTHDDRTGEMLGFKYGSATGGEHAAHGAQATAAGTSAASTNPHAAHGTTPGAATADTSVHARMMDLHVRMLADTGIRRHVLADTALRRMVQESLTGMSGEHRAHLEAMLAEPLPAPAPARRPAARTTTRPAARPAAKPRTTAKPPTKPAAKPADPHAGHKP